MRGDGVSESKTSSTVKLAEKWAGDLERDIERGEHCAGARQTRLLELLARYDEKVVAKMEPKAAATARKHLAWWSAKLSELTGSKAPTLAQITVARIISAREALETEAYKRSTKADALCYSRGPATVNR